MKIWVKNVSHVILSANTITPNESKPSSSLTMCKRLRRLVSNGKYTIDFCYVKASDIVRNYNYFGFLKFLSKSEEERYTTFAFMSPVGYSMSEPSFQFSLEVVMTKANLLHTCPFLVHFADFCKISLNCEGYGACKEKECGAGGI